MNPDTRPVPRVPVAQVALWQQDIERRLKALETSNPLESSSIRSGLLRVLDEEGRRVVEVGELTSGGHGIEVFDPVSQNLRWSSKNP